MHVVRVCTQSVLLIIAYNIDVAIHSTGLKEDRQFGEKSCKVRQKVV